MPTPDEIRALLAEMRGAGGVGHGVESLEVFLLFPDEFRRRYAELCERALKGALESGGSGGEGGGDAGALGKAKVDSKWKGKRVGAGTGGGGKRYKQFWTVRDEHALEVKTKIDRRLRALARDMSTMLEVRTETVVVDSGVTTSGRCSRCGRYVERGWYYCPTCGGEVGTEGRRGRPRGDGEGEGGDG